MKLTKKDLKKIIREELEEEIVNSNIADTAELNVDEAFEKEFSAQLQVEGLGKWAAKLGGAAKTLAKGTMFGKVMAALQNMAARMRGPQKTALLATMIEKLGMTGEEALASIKRVGTGGDETSTAQAGATSVSTPGYTGSSEEAQTAR